jgi:hypothetical protein
MSIFLFILSILIIFAIRQSQHLKEDNSLKLSCEHEKVCFVLPAYGIADTQHFLGAAQNIDRLRNTACLN